MINRSRFVTVAAFSVNAQPLRMPLGKRHITKWLAKDSLQGNGVREWAAALILFVAVVASVAPQPAFAQTVKVDMSLLATEVQKQSLKPDAITTVFWWPEEYWRASFDAQPMISEEQKETILAVLRPYTLVVLTAASIGPLGGMTFLAEANLRESTQLVDEHGDVYRPLPEEEVNPDARNMVDMLKPVLANAMGQMGQNIQLFFFPAVDGQGHRIAEATKEGFFSVRVGEENFRWRLPLGSLLPPKVCPVDGERLSGAWKYCPWHGAELVEVEDTTANRAIPTVDRDSLVLEALLDEPAERLSGPLPQYPDELRQAGIEGTVLLEFVIDTMGRVEEESIKILRSTNTAFEAPAREVIRKSLYSSGRIRGQAVRVLVSQALGFTIQRDPDTER